MQGLDLPPFALLAVLLDKCAVLPWITQLAQALCFKFDFGFLELATNLLQIVPLAEILLAGGPIVGGLVGSGFLQSSR